MDVNSFLCIQTHTYAVLHNEHEDISAISISPSLASVQNQHQFPIELKQKLWKHKCTHASRKLDGKKNANENKCEEKTNSKNIMDL